MSDNNEIDLPESTVLPAELSKEMRTSFLEYSMSVIVSRALPDVRDGLKPCLLYTSPSPRDTR